MGFLRAAVLTLATVAASQAMAWGNHALATYRAFEKMPELANAPNVVAEPLEAFLRDEENTIEALLASQEAWARSNLEKYPARPPALAFTADPTRSDEARRNAFLMALRVAPNSKFALYFQADLWNPVVGTSLAPSAVSTLSDIPASTSKFLALKPGDTVPALAVLASAAEEPDYGLDINLWEDTPSDWSRQYAMGPQPYGSMAQQSSSQAPFHMAFLHENRMVYLAAPNLRQSYLPLRVYQFSTLSALAFRTGHAYWGWRFAGIALHYIQDATQPFQTCLAPSLATARLMLAHTLALTGLRGLRDDLIQQLVNRQWVLNRLQAEWMERNAASKQDTALEKALRAVERDKNSPDWSDRYVRDVASAQANATAAGLLQSLNVSTLGSLGLDTGAEAIRPEAGTRVIQDVLKRDSAERNRLESALAELMGNLGTHSRNALRGILRASSPP